MLDITYLWSTESEVAFPYQISPSSYIVADKSLNAGVNFKRHMVSVLLSSNNIITIMMNFKTKLILKHEPAATYFSILGFTLLETGDISMQEKFL